jgi:hypothetical protein
MTEDWSKPFKAWLCPDCNGFGPLRVKHADYCPQLRSIEVVVTLADVGCPNKDGVPVCGPAHECPHVSHGNGSRWDRK